MGYDRNIVTRKDISGKVEGGIRYDRNIVTRKDIPEMAKIDSFLKGDFQKVLNQFGCRYTHQSFFKKKGVYEDQIRLGDTWNLWCNNQEIIADIKRNVSEDKNITLEIRILDNIYGGILDKVFGQYDNIIVKKLE